MPRRKGMKKLYGLFNHLVWQSAGTSNPSSNFVRVNSLNIQGKADRTGSLKMSLWTTACTAHKTGLGKTDRAKNNITDVMD